MHENGNGVEKSYERAKEWYLKYAQGNPACLYRIAENYRYGRGVAEKDYVKAIEWFERAAAASKNNPKKALKSIGAIYDDGGGVE